MNGQSFAAEVDGFLRGLCLFCTSSMIRYLLLSCSFFAVSIATAQLDIHMGMPTAQELFGELKKGGGPDEMVSTSETYTEVNRLIIEENWTEAEVLLERLLQEQPNNRNFAYKRALCLWSIKGRMAEAVGLVQRSIEGDFAKRYNAFDAKAALPPEESLDLALDVLQYSGHYAEAQAVATIIINRYPKRDFRHVRAERAILDCDFAMRCVARPTPLELKAESQLNSASRDYAPVIAPDGNAVYFTSYRNQESSGGAKRGRIYRALKTERGWSRPIALDLGIAGRDMTTVGLIGDEEALVVYQGYRNAGSLWKLERDEAGGWMLEEKVGFPVDSRHWETSMSERFDGMERVFVSNRPGGQGGRDLYRTVMLPDGSWSEPLNLGSRINTPGEEESPVVSSDGRVLIFASTGHQGMGGFDLFRCIRLDNGSWSDPEHMGYPLNTPGDEAMASLDASGQTGFVSSARAGGQDLDIYRFEMKQEPEEALAVFIGDIPSWRKGDVLEVKSTDDGPAVFRVFRARSESGSFVAALPPCREYKFNWVRRNEVLESRTEFVECDAAYGNENVVNRLAPFGTKDFQAPTEPEEIDTTNPSEEEPEGLDVVVEDAMNPVDTQSGGGQTEVGSEAMDEGESVVAPSHSFDSAETATQEGEDVAIAIDTEATEDSEGTIENVGQAEAEPLTEDALTEEGAVEENKAADSAIESATDAVAEVKTKALDAEVSEREAVTSLTMVEFEAVTSTVEFGYGRYLTESGSKEVRTMVAEVAKRSAMGEVPILQIEGSASFVPVKNKRAYESNEELARMRAEKARDAVITAMSAQGLQVGVDFQIVLDWEVAGPEFKGDAVAGQNLYRNFQFAKFSMGRQLVEQRH